MGRVVPREDQIRRKRCGSAAPLDGDARAARADPRKQAHMDGAPAPSARRHDVKPKASRAASVLTTPSHRYTYLYRYRSSSVTRQRLSAH